MSIETMKQALTKFEHLWEIGIDAEYKVELLPEIEALRQAIEQAEQWDTSDMAHRSGGLSVEQAEKQEPKAWIYEGNLHIFDPTDWAIEPDSVQPLYTAPVKREWVGLTDEEIKNILDCGRGGLVDIKKAEQILKEKNNG